MQTDTNRYEDAANLLRRSRKTWLVTGVAGFIGSNVLELLLQLDQTVVGLDNFATGHRENIRQVVSDVEGDATRVRPPSLYDVRSPSGEPPRLLGVGLSFDRLSPSL